MEQQSTEQLVEMDNKPSQKNGKGALLPASIVIAALIIAAAWVFASKIKSQGNGIKNTKNPVIEVSQEEIMPEQGVVLPVKWGNLGVKLVASGVIDTEKLDKIYEERGGMSESVKKFLYEENSQPMRITAQNSGELLNLFWAVGLGNKNTILEKGPMADPKYGGAENFASTGGWPLAKGNVMSHYSRHEFTVLNPEQQELVEKVSKNIFRPCCGNSVYFPDCNHGMAMLGLLELMASQGAGEDEMYKIALKVNSYWFPDTYMNIARYLKSKNIEWSESDPKNILGYNFSSSGGYKEILNQITPAQPKSGSSCGA